MFWQEDKSAVSFKYKADMMKYIEKLGLDAIGGLVRYDMDALNSSFGVREWIVWYGKRKGERLVLKQEDFRGRKFIHKPHKIEKQIVKSFIWSEKIGSLMYHISRGKYTDSNLINLLLLFDKSGFKDFELEDEYDIEYLNRDNHKSLELFEEWDYWADRCDFVRMKVIHDLIKKDCPKAFKIYEDKRVIKRSATKIQKHRSKKLSRLSSKSYRRD